MRKMNLKDLRKWESDMTEQLNWGSESCGYLYYKKKKKEREREREEREANVITIEWTRAREADIIKQMICIKDKY